jgi:hypothetical protein
MVVDHKRRSKAKGKSKMIKILIEVLRDSAPVSIVVWAENIGWAVELAGRYYPEDEIRVSFPINPEQFFVKDLGGAAKIAQLEGAEEREIQWNIRSERASEQWECLSSVYPAGGEDRVRA